MLHYSCNGSVEQIDKILSSIIPILQERTSIELQKPNFLAPVQKKVDSK